MMPVETLVMYNRRLGKGEGDTFLDILETSTDRGYSDRELARKYLMQSDVVTLLSSVEDNAVGATCVQKDKNRMGMVLSAVAVAPPSRDTSAFSLVTSSLPFFRSVSIRDVDVLVSNEEPISLGFPLNPAADPWLESTLLRAGFEEIGEVLQIEGRLRSTQSEDFTRSWDNPSILEGARELLWDGGREIGLATSLAWTALDFAHHLGRLQTVSHQRKVALLAGVHTVGDTAVITPVLSNPDLITHEQVWNMLRFLVVREGLSNFALPLLGQDQTKLAEVIDRGEHGRLVHSALLRKRV